MSGHNKVRKYQPKRGAKQERILKGDVSVGMKGYRPPNDDYLDGEIPDYDDLPRNSTYEATESIELRTEIEKKFATFLREDLSSEDPTDLLNALDHDSLDQFAHGELVAFIIRAGLETTTQREIISQLLASLSLHEYVSRKQMEKGFLLVLQQLPDLELDNPNASETVGKFLARAVADDCIQPSWVNAHPGFHDVNYSGELATNALKIAHALISVKGEFSRLDSIWGVVGAYQPVRSLVNQIKALIDEYTVTNNKEEALRCLHDLAVPHFHHEFVYECILKVLEFWSEELARKISSLLSTSFAEGFVPIEEMTVGFRRVFKDIDDIVLDVPKAYELLPLFVKIAVDDGYVPTSILKEVPTKSNSHAAAS